MKRIDLKSGKLGVSAGRLLKVLGVLLAVVISQSGCSVIGLGTGAVLDASRPDHQVLSGGQISQVKGEKKVIVFLKSGEKKEGMLEGLKCIPQAEYSRKYNEYCDRLPDSVFLPYYGDTVDIALTSGPSLKKRFIGFDYRLDRDRFKKGTLPAYVVVGSLNEKLTTRINTDEIKKITDHSGSYIERNAIEDLMLRTEIPVLSSAIIKLPEGREEIALEDIDNVVILNSKNSKFYGLALGLGVDITAFLIIINSDIPENIMKW